MITWLTGGVVVLVLTGCWLRRLARTDRAVAVALAAVLALSLAVVAAGWLVASGRGQVLWVAVLAVLPWLRRLVFLLQPSVWRAVGGLVARSWRRRRERGARTDDIRTPSLTVRRRGDGTMHGELHAGPWAGRTLETMSRDEVVGALTDLRTRDHAAAAVLAHYLRQVHGVDPDNV